MSSGDFSWNGQYPNYNSLKSGNNQLMGWPLPHSDGYGTAGTHMASMQAIGGHSMMQGNNLNQEANLRNATNLELLQAGNKAFIDLQNEKLKLEYALEAQRGLVEQLLSSRIQTILPISSNMKATPDIHDTVPEDLKPSPLPEPLQQEDYPNVRYWTQQEWSKYIDQEKEMGRTYSSMGWLTDEDGAEVDEEVLKKMTLEAYGIFSNFFYLRLDPNTWRLRQPEVAAFFSNTMRTKFPILNLANGDWKANLFATTRYPNWNRYHRATGHLKRKYPSIRSSGVGEPNHSHRSKKKRKQLAAKAISISDDEDGPSHSSTSHTGHTAPPPSAEIMSGKHKPRPCPQHQDNANAAPAASSDSSDILAPLSTNKLNILSPVSLSELSASGTLVCGISTPATSIQPRCGASKSTSSPTPADVVAGTSATAASVASAYAIDASTTSIQPCTNTSPPNPTPVDVATGNSATAIGLGTNSGSAVRYTSSSTVNGSAAPLTTLDQDVQSPTGPTATTNADRPPATTEASMTTSDEPLQQPLSFALSSVNNSGTGTLTLFNDLRIPEPVQQVPLQTTSINTTTVTAAASETRKRKGKIMAPQGNSVTARNLFALDHMLQHPMTTVTEFGRIWKDLDKDSRDKYEAMSKEKNIEKKAHKK